MKNNHSKKIIFYVLILFISLIFVGLVGAVIRLINIPAIIITLLISFGLIYYKRIGWLQDIINSMFRIKSDNKLLDLSLKSK